MIKKNKIINFLIFLISIYLILFILNYTLGLYPDFNNHKIYHSDESELCLSKKDRLNLEGDNIYSDSGYRNESYTKKMPDLEQVWFDSVCKLKVYSENGSLKVKSIFPNYTYKINNLGYRGKKWDDINENNTTKKVFILGGSTAFSFFNNENNTIDSFLEKKLNIKYEESKKKYIVYNAAIPGAISNEEYLILRTGVANKQPSIVVFLTGFNDSGQIQTTYIRYMPYDSSLFYFLYKVLDFLNFDRLKKILHFPLKKKMDNVSAFKKSTLKIQKFCKKNKIRCIFALQPNITNETYFQSKSEERIKYLWDRFVQKGRGKRIKLDDNQFDKWFKNKENEFEYIDLRNIGSMGMFYGQITGKSSKTLVKNINRKGFKIFKNVAEGAYFEIKLNDDKLFKGLCEELKINLIKVSEYQSSCNVSGYDNLSKYMNFETFNKGYMGILNSSLGYLDFVININKFIDEIEISANLKNFADNKAHSIEFKISYDGINFFEPKGFLEFKKKDPYTFSHKIEKNVTLNKIYIRLKFKKHDYIGINSLSIKLNGEMQNFEITNPLKIDNIGIADFFISQKHRNAPDEIFVDAAHLTPSANELIAEKIAKQILN